MDIMRPGHPRWEDFIVRLHGPEGCNFTGEGASMSFTCDGSTLSKSEAILTDMGDIDVDESLDYFRDHGGHCDCEVIFNVLGNAPESEAP